jgi:hypothetical protein
VRALPVLLTKAVAVAAGQKVMLMAAETSGLAARGEAGSLYTAISAHVAQRVALTPLLTATQSIRL